MGHHAGACRVGGEFDQITFQHEEPFILLGLNADGRLNQGRLDHTFAITEPTGLSNLPWVDMRVGATTSPKETASWSAWNTTGPPQIKALRHRMWRV